MATPSSRSFRAPLTAFYSLALCKASLLCLLFSACQSRLASLLTSFPQTRTCPTSSHLRTLLVLSSVSPQCHTVASLPTLRAWGDITVSQSVSLTALHPPSHTAPFTCSLVSTCPGDYSIYLSAQLHVFCSPKCDSKLLTGSESLISSHCNSTTNMESCPWILTKWLTSEYLWVSLSCFKEWILN